jgi:hypothetical protein
MSDLECPKCRTRISSETLICTSCKIEVQPLSIYDSANINQPINHLVLDFGSRQRESISERLFEIDEPKLLEKVAESRLKPLRGIFNRLQTDIDRCWIATNVPTDQLIEKGLQKKLLDKTCVGHKAKIAGDIDLIVGNIASDDLSFEHLFAFQVKKRRMDTAANLKDFSSGLGTGQASFTALMGFDRTVLLHLFVREPGPTTDEVAPSWKPIINSEFSTMMRASYNLIKDRLKRELYGYAWFGWGQAFGKEPEECGGFRLILLLTLRSGRGRTTLTYVPHGRC